MSQQNQNNKNPKNGKVLSKQNIIENFRDLGKSTAGALGTDLLRPVGEDFMRELLGLKTARKFSGEISPGESLEMKNVLSGKEEENKKLKKQLLGEKSLREEIERSANQKAQALNLQLSAITQEVAALSKNTQGLTREVEIASVQAPVNPGVYHLIFFEKLLEFIKSFRKKIEDAAVWLTAYNRRSAKRRGFWGQVKMSGAKRLLSAEDNLQRSAG